ncbi:Uncharacterized RNA pseudouridine synthase YjbO [[Clostridium] ultunense Esp]|uniref:RluA family pseudouridine synthase n=1 Tax=Thermicanus aegyptius TaxID=94009 RepID=UPI0002B70198|nr:RluA family pseudouridine synthase [Thermicanus aegyptius]CCQ96092.1 Uncharacterized RNA pseudouridine synthase YjbO [[Clostridium] ultunense Esp]
METRLFFHVDDGEEGWQLKGYLKSKRVSVSLLRRIKREGLLLLNGERATVHQRVAKGDRVEILFPDPPLPIVPPEPIPLSVLLEDEDLLLINKPAGIAVHPTYNYSSGTLANGISYYWEKKGEMRPVRLVHRLDKETSGILIVAKHAYAQYFLSEGYRQGEYRKWYDLFVHGLLAEEEGFIELPIGLAQGSIIKRTILAEGPPARTKFRVRRRYPKWNVTWVEAELFSGKTHQIRVHFSHLGHPLLGDDLYGGEKRWMKRQALHASRVHFLHPRTLKAIQMESPWPEDLLRLKGFLENEENEARDFSKR